MLRGVMRVSHAFPLIVVGGLILASAIAFLDKEAASARSYAAAAQTFAAFAMIALTVEIMRVHQETISLAWAIEHERKEREQAIFEIANAHWNGPQRIDFVVHNVGFRPGTIKSIQLKQVRPDQEDSFEGNGIQRVFGFNDEKGDLSIPAGAGVRFQCGFSSEITSEGGDLMLIVEPGSGRPGKSPLPLRAK